MSYIDFEVTKECINPDSYGMKCVKCNACGRFDRTKQKESAIKLYNRLMKGAYSFENWIEGLEDIQRSNVRANIKYLKEKIRELEKKE